MFGVEHVDVQLKHMSSECFFNSTEEQVHKDLIAFATKEFRLLENSSSDQRICSMYVDNINGRAEFYYKCCFRNANFSFECRIIEKTFWVNILFFAMTFIYIVAFLYSPLLIPTSWYKKNVVTFTFSLSKTIFISFTKKDTKSNVDHNTYILTNKDKEHMDNFKSKVSVLDKTNNKDKASCVYWDIKEVKIRLQDTKKTSSTFVPGSMFHFLYRTFVECRVKDHEYVEECCDAKCCPCYEDLKWLSFLQLFILMYVAIGVILNASQVVTYVTFAGILIFYAYNSIRQVLNKYERFSQTVFKYIMRNLKDLKCGLKNIALQLKLTEDRNALEPAEDCIAPSQSIVVENNKIMLSSEMPFVFFDDHGKPSINEEVFFKMCHINSNGAPGSLWGNYKKAFIHFFIIVLFLLLVATIVLAFGQSKGVTGTYLALATLGGGLIPLILRKYFFRSHDLCDCGTEQNLFWDEVKPMFTKYETSFEVDDIIGDIQNDPSFKNDSSENNEYKKINIKFPIESEDPTESDVPDQHKVIREVDTRV
ncbi:unnamed protein product [Mytilus coruscus]|uniref:Uncharacterized protein n=1 Tax=Mytilus coruscus TaxID=42192 RepID=A0A6J8AMH2_MYTCO|nr:unnamed protein product [Mytilus coruscus]